MRDGHEAVQASVADVLGALDDKVVVHERISNTTAAPRDALLPQLSGANPAG